MGKDSNNSREIFFYPVSTYIDRRDSGGKTGSFSAKRFLNLDGFLALGKNPEEAIRALEKNPYDPRYKVERTSWDQRYQVKLSVFNNRRAQELKPIRALFRNNDSVLDTENFREMIATDILREIAVEDRKTLVPKIDFIIDDSNPEDERRIGITSKWLPPAAIGPLSFEQFEQSLDDEAAGTAEFIQMGNHDCNASNFLRSGNRIAAIDYGKAFNALLNAPKRFGGRLRYPENQVIDYLNREALPSGRDTTPKLWQDENGHAPLVPSDRLVKAMEAQAEAASPENIQRGIDKSKEHYLALLAKKDKDGNDFFDKAHQEHILKSVIEVARNIEGAKISFNPKLSNEDNLNQAFEVIKTSQLKRAEEMKEAARIMKAQLALDRILDTPDSPSREEQIDAWRNEYNPNNTKRTWIKSSKDIAAFKGTVEEYIKSYPTIKAQAALDKILRSQDPNPTIEAIQQWSTDHNIDLHKPISWMSPSNGEEAVTGTVRDYIKQSAKRLKMDKDSQKVILSHTTDLERTGRIARLKRALSPSRGDNPERDAKFARTASSEIELQYQGQKTSRDTIRGSSGRRSESYRR